VTNWAHRLEKSGAEFFTTIIVPFFDWNEPPFETEPWNVELRFGKSV
jgi:hypothetical protein